MRAKMRMSFKLIWFCVLFIGFMRDFRVIIEYCISPDSIALTGTCIRTHNCSPCSALKCVKCANPSSLQHLQPFATTESCCMLLGCAENDPKWKKYKNVCNVFMCCLHVILFVCCLHDKHTLKINIHYLKSN